MNNYIILNKKKNINKISNILNDLELKKTFKNKRTEIWENDDLQISIDKSIIRILIFSNNDVEHYKKIITRG